MENFEQALEETLLTDYNISITENGALGYATTGKALLDMNFKTSSYRVLPEGKIIADFIEAFNENKILAIKWLFFARDIRGGMGERRLFRVCMKWLAENYKEYVVKLLPVIAEYGRWDDVLELLNTNCKEEVVAVIRAQLTKDIACQADKKPISLLAKWMPSEQASSEYTKKLARLLVSELHISNREYRKTLSKLREYLKVVERDMSANNWSEINYEAVPSKANLNYSGAFLRHDSERRLEYLDKLESGEAKINSSTLYPSDIVHKYFKTIDWDGSIERDTTLEALWGALPAYELSNTLVVADGSGSMMGTPWEVAHSLAIYCAQHNQGEFYNKYITFSSKPQLVKLSDDSLATNLQICLKHYECSNTDIEAVFNLILKAALKNGMKQEDMPHNVLIISDMEFDEAQRDWVAANVLTEPLFKQIEQKYIDAGYKLPRLVFWNVASRTNTIPVMQNDLGVALISGYSPAVMKMVMSDNLNPYDCLLETLNSERYSVIDEVLA